MLCQALQLHSLPIPKHMHAYACCFLQQPAIASSVRLYTLTDKPLYLAALCTFGESARAMSRFLQWHWSVPSWLWVHEQLSWLWVHAQLPPVALRSAMMGFQVPIPDHMDIYHLHQEAEPSDRTALQAVVDHIEAEVARLNALEEHIMMEYGPEDERLQVSSAGHFPCRGSTPIVMPLPIVGLTMPK